MRADTIGEAFEEVAMRDVHADDEIAGWSTAGGDGSGRAR